MWFGLLAVAVLLYMMDGVGMIPIDSNADDEKLTGVDPSFAKAVKRVLLRMRAMGFDAVVNNGLRTPEQARANAAKGVGIADSMHIYGLAVDIVSKSKGWNVPTTFWSALNSIAVSEGLTTGLYWTKPDPAHVQAVTVAEEPIARAWTPEARADTMRQRFG